jgi:hypothetical protein
MGLSAYVSSRIHIYALVFMLGVVTIDLIFDGPIIIGMATDDDYLTAYHYYTNTMPHLLATTILPIVVVLGSIGVLSQVYLDKSILSYICLVMALVGGSGYGQMLQAEAELQALKLDK